MGWLRIAQDYHQLHPIPELEFRQDPGDGFLGGFGLDEQPLTYLRVGHSLGDEPRHVAFPGGQQPEAFLCQALRLSVMVVNQSG